MDFIDFKIIDAIDIAVVALLLLQIYRMIRGTAALTIFVGIFIVYLLYVTVKVLNMDLLSSILGQVVGVGAIALVVVFQQEIRRYLLMLGTRISNNKNRFLRRIFSAPKNNVELTLVNELSAALCAMSATKTGALIAIERTSDLDIYATSGDIVDGTISTRLIEAIFFKNSPMHDGAMIIKHGRINAARCILPTSDNPAIPPHMGLRHRAAIGLSEHSDALVIVLSEETGKISIVESGEITTLKNSDNLSEKLAEKLAE